jgi:hypothetical protein
VSKIVGLAGRAPPQPNGAEPDVIQMLEEALEKARSGDVVSVGLVLVSPRGLISPWWANPGAAAHYLVAGCEYLKAAIIRNAAED